LSRWMCGWQSEGARRAAEGEWMLGSCLESELEEWDLMEVILFEVMVTSEGLEVPGRVTLVMLSVSMVSKCPTGWLCLVIFDSELETEIDSTGGE
jgi:hypothetical protein